MAWTEKDIPDLTGRTAVVTGANGGLGYQTALALAGAGAHVVMAARDPETTAAAETRLRERYPAASLAVVPLDLGDLSVVAGAAQQILGAHERVDLLVNNAGMIDEFEVPLWEADPDQWWDVVTSHVKGGFLLARTVVPWMVLRNRGRVVNLASGMSVRARPEYSAYSVAKTGLMRVTEALAGALEGTDVRAFDVAPGVVETEMTRAMPMWKGFTDWTPPASVVELVSAIAAGELDQWTGRFLRAGKDDVAALRELTPADAARQLRLEPYGDADPLA